MLILRQLRLQFANLPIHLHLPTKEPLMTKQIPLDVVLAVRTAGPEVDGPFGALDDIATSVAALQILVTLSTDDMLKVVERAVAERGELEHSGKTHDLYAIDHGLDLCGVEITRVGFSRQ